MKLSDFSKNVVLAPYTTFKIGGRARYFFIAKTKQDLVEAIALARKSRIPFFIMGGGSNLLVSDKGYKGLVIRTEMAKWAAKKSRTGFEVFAEAGVLLADLVVFSLKSGARGLEWAAGIPGARVGGSIFGNAGAFKQEISDIVESAEVLDTRNFTFKILKNKECKFGYRESVFKKRGNWVIVSAVLKMEKGSLNQVKKKVRENIVRRVSVHPSDIPSAGSVFKNPGKLSAGKLLEQCGLKGKKFGRAMISSRHANFVSNLGGARASDVKKLMDFAKKEVKKKFKVNLEEEIRFL
jgi:UDP-N-acetylmuramate dehydrogenase